MNQHHPQYLPNQVHSIITYSILLLSCVKTGYVYIDYKKKKKSVMFKTELYSKNNNIASIVFKTANWYVVAVELYMKSIYILALKM